MIGKTSQTMVTGSGMPVDVHYFDVVDYQLTLDSMKDAVEEKGSAKQNQIWLLEHESVYTQGTSCEMSPLSPSDIPLVKTDRGGQITYHGPGQIVMYPILRLRDYGLGVKSLVSKLEQAAIDTLAMYAVTAERRNDAPGVYVGGDKIAALGLRVRHGTSYHGLSLNVSMDLSPFRNIDPCGYQGLAVSQLSDLADDCDQKLVRQQLLENFLKFL